MANVVTGVFMAKINGRDGELIVSGNSESVKMVAVNLNDGSTDLHHKMAILAIENELEIERLYETLKRILGR